MLKKNSISVVAPAYNEEDCIKEFVGRAINAFEDNNLKGEILIIDDCSTDKTNKILRKILRKTKLVRVIKNKKNLGLTGAAWVGFENAKGDIIVFLPSDLESDPREDIPLLLEPLSSGYDMSIGRRYGGKIGLIKGLTSYCFNFLARLLFQIDLHDMGWVKAFKRDILKDIELRSDWHRLFPIFVADKGYKIKEVRTKFYPRALNRSKYGKLGLRRLPGGFFDMIAVKFLVSFSKKPMFVFGGLGTLFLVTGFVLGSYLFILKIINGTIGQRLPLMFLTILLIIAGIQLFALGFLAELVVSLKESMKK